MIELRSYQTDLLERARAAMRRGVKRLLLVSPTGSGKTCMFAVMTRGAIDRGKHVHVWAHRKELIEQTLTTLQDAAGVFAGVVMAGYPPTPLAQAQVCSVQSLARRTTLRAPDIIICDETHHLCSPTYAALAAKFPDAYFIGVTATPIRLDRRGLKPWFDEMIVGPSTADLVAQGYLSPYVLYAPTVAGPDLSGVGTVAGDYNKAALRNAMDNSTIVGDAVEYYQQHAPGARALVFMWSIDASEKLAQRFREAGIAAMHVDGETPDSERADTMRRFRAGDVRVICSVDIFGEGIDVPAVDAVFLCRPTQSLGLYLQQVGRGLRMSPGKTAVKVFDHAGNWTRHGLPDTPRTWTLEDAPKKKPTIASGRRCLKCHAVSPAGAAVCVACQAPFPVTPRQVAQVNGALVAWRKQSDALIAEHRKNPRPFDLHYWELIGRERGYKRGWAYWRWREHLGKAKSGEVDI